jgi:ketosteroid isomerase-like protein
MTSRAISTTSSRRAALVLPLLAMLALPATLRAATTEEELRALEDQRREAIRIQDFGTLGRIYAPEFVAVASNGQVMDRTQLFQMFARGSSAQKFSTDDIRVQDLGQTAVFIGRLTARAPTGEITFTTRFSHVFVKRDGLWKCVYGHSTPIVEP